MADQNFTAACAYELRFGKHKGSTIARVGSSDEGLKYLDWLVGQAWVVNGLKSALEAYLAHPSISRLLDAAIDDD
jgi:hypothetical protein